MVVIRLRYLIVLMLVSVYLSGIGFAVLLDRDFGNLDVGIVSIPDQDHQLSGLLYRPIDATDENPLAAIVLVHGISSSKQMVSHIALELARNGFVTLALDLVGHGNSGGVFGDGDIDPTLGTLVSVRYLESQSFVNASSIGLVGHSLGAGAIRATAAAHRNIAASVFIGGGFGSMVTNLAYDTLNSTFPENLLIAVGKYDVLFDMDQLGKELSTAFGTQEILPNRLYGNFSTETARKLITPATTHLFEPFDPSVVSEIVLWMSNALKSESVSQSSIPPRNFIYLYREVAISVSLFAFVGLIFPISITILNFFPSAVNDGRSKTKYGILEDWKSLIIWGSLGLILFIPMIFVGFLIPVPPLVFGSSFAWWFSTVAILGLLLVFYLLPKFSTVKLNLERAVSESFNLSGAAIALILFTLFYLIANLTESTFLFDLRIIVPLFNDLNPVIRILNFFMLVPFFLVYFFVEGFYLHEFHRWSNPRYDFRSEIFSVGKVIAIKISPYIAVLCMQYVPMLLLNFRPFPGFIGLLIEFLWGIVPLFIISTACSWWFYRSTSSIGMGAIFNALLFAWSAAATFPLRAFG